MGAAVAQGQLKTNTTLGTLEPVCSWLYDIWGVGPHPASLPCEGRTGLHSKQSRTHAATPAPTPVATRPAATTPPGATAAPAAPLLDAAARGPAGVAAVARCGAWTHAIVVVPAPLLSTAVAALRNAAPRAPAPVTAPAAPPAARRRARRAAAAALRQGGTAARAARRVGPVPFGPLTRASLPIVITPLLTGSLGFGRRCRRCRLQGVPQRAALAA
jgi:hypothetical protein